MLIENDDRVFRIERGTVVVAAPLGDLQPAQRPGAAAMRQQHIADLGPAEADQLVEIEPDPATALARARERRRSGRACR